MPLAGTPPRYHFDDRERHDLQVGGHATLRDILQVAADHAVKVGVVAVRNLPPAGDAWLNSKALQVVLCILSHLVR